MTLLIVIGLVILAVGCICLGYRMAGRALRLERMRLDRERQALDIEWAHFQQAQRIRAVFIRARQAMQAEAGHSSTEERRAKVNG